jgi:N-acyl-D-aspartate/D-glutamate deacylase
MRALLREALQAGAAGFSTGRSDNHRTSEGKDTPAANAGSDELTGLAQAFEGLSHGVLQIVSDFNLLNGPDQFDAEFDSVEVDNEVIIRSSRKLLVGKFVQVKITKAYDFDLEGELVS